MSQPRMRKVVASGDGEPRARVSVAKASGDSDARNVHPKHETQRSRSKNKIPKSVRYDLENALVSLCDVWFEEIKPHLVRNNIKLHVHGSSAGGDHERPPPARPVPPDHPTPTCSHLDPGAAPDQPQRQDASYAGCCSTPQTASRVPCRKPPVSSRQLLSLLPSQPTTLRDCIQTQSHICEEKQKRPRTRRKKRRFQPQPQSSWRVPRLCRTYSILSPAIIESHTRRIASYQPPHPPRNDYYQFIVPRRNTAMKNKSTQTEEALPRPRTSVGCQWAPAPALCSAPQMRRACAWEHTAVEHSPSPQRVYRAKRTEPTAAKELPLFRDDLIDIIGERNDKKLRLLYNSPKRDDCPSFMNLVPSPTDRLKKPGGWKKSPPWR